MTTEENIQRIRRTVNALRNHGLSEMSQTDEIAAALEAIANLLEFKSGYVAWERFNDPSRKDIVGVRICSDGQREFLIHNEASCSPYWVARG